MANRAYLRIWTRDFSETTMIPEFARFLTTASLSTSQSAFTELRIQAVDPTEIPVAEGRAALGVIRGGLGEEEGRPPPAGHFAGGLGLEHFFTGHGGILAPAAASNPFGSSDHPLEHTFRQWMSASGNLKEYHAKTRENIQQLFNWVEAIEAALPVERSELSSEGEENFEARLDAILVRR